MIISHLNALEQILIAQSKVAQNSGHPNLRGGPREWFIRDFLQAHLPSTLEIGQGEIIDANSIPNPSPGSYRPQTDVVIYRRDLPKLSFSPNDIAFLSEGVMATIESKSFITEAELKNANKAANVHSGLVRASSTMRIGRVHKMYKYVVAYDGPANMSTVADWIGPQLTTNNWTAENVVDMIVVLGKGVVWKLSSFPELTIQNTVANSTWAFVNQTDKNLLTLFIHILTWANASSSPPNVLEYVSNVQFQNVQTI